MRSLEKRPQQLNNRLFSSSVEAKLLQTAASLHIVFVLVIAAEASKSLKVKGQTEMTL